MIKAVRKASGSEADGLDEEDQLHILQSIGYEGRIYIRFVTHEDAQAFKHNMDGEYLYRDDKKPLEVEWAENDCTAHNSSNFKDPHQINLPRSFELVWIVPPGPFYNMSTRESANAISGFLHPLKGLYKSRRKRLNRQALADSAAAAASSKGEQSLQLQDKADDPTIEADRAGRSGSETSDRPKEAAPVTGAPECAVIATAPQGK